MTGSTKTPSPIRAGKLIDIVESDIYAHMAEEFELRIAYEVINNKALGVTVDDMNRIYKTLIERGMIDASSKANTVH